MTSDLNSTLSWLRKKKVFVLKGGWSSERSISLKTGAAIEASFKRLKIKFKSIDVQKNLPVVLSKNKPDFCFLALHGTFGEDGRIQGLLDILGVPYTGENAMVSGVAMDKETSKKIFKVCDVPTLPWLVVSKEEWGKNRRNVEQQLKKIFKGNPLFVKPVDQGSAVGVSLVKSLKNISEALSKCFRVADKAMVEQYFKGREFTVGVLGTTVMPVVEILPEHTFYDFHSKYAKGGSRHLVPAPLRKSETLKIQNAGLAAFQSIGGKVYGRVDVLMDKSGKVNVLEVNTIPGMTETSLLPDAAKAMKMSFDELALKIVQLSLKAR